MTKDTSLSTAQILRRIILGIIFIGTVGAVVELFFIGHYKEFTQWPPFILLGLTAIGVILMTRNPSPRMVQLFRWLMVIVALSSLAGIFFHLKGNVEFKMETKPDLKGLTLLWKSMLGGIPILAPGIMAQIGMLGLGYTFKHPNLEVEVLSEESKAGLLENIDYFEKRYR